MTAGQDVPPRQTIDTFINVNLPVVTVVPTTPRHPQKRGLSPGLAGCYSQRKHKLKYVKSVSCVTQLSCVKPVTNLTTAAPNLPVGARLQNFWQTWLDLGAGPKVVQILKEGYTPFRIRPNLVFQPSISSTKTQQQMEACTRCEQIKSFIQGG